MEITFHFVQEVLKDILRNDILKWSVILAKGVSFIIVILHYFRLYYSSFGDKDKRINVYEIIRPLIYIVLLASYTTIMDGLDEITVAVESSWASFDSTKLIDQFDEQTQEEIKNSTPAPPINPDEQTAKSVSKIWNMVNNPSIILVKIVDWLVYAIDAMIFAFAVIARAAFLFVLRFLAPLAIVASIFDAYRKYFWNWLKIYLIVYMGVYIWFVINIFSDAFLSKMWELKVNTGISEVASTFSTGATLLMLCMVLVKTFLYGKSVQLMYKVYNSNS